MIEEDNILKLLDENAQTALYSLAVQELRNPRTQAVILIYEGLKRRKLLSPAPAAPKVEVQHEPA